MQKWQYPFLGLSQFPSKLSSFEIEQFFSFSPTEKQLIELRRIRVHRLALALQIGFMRMTGRPLNNVNMLPQSLLQHLGETLQIEPPTLASIRALYKRKRTLYEHQNIATEVLKLKPYTDRTARSLTVYLRKEASHVFHKSQLMLSARRWLYEKHYLLPGYYRLEAIVRKSILFAEKQLLSTINKDIPEGTVRQLAKLLEQPIAKRSSPTVYEWLQIPPTKAKAIEPSLEKMRYLLDKGIHASCFEQIPLDPLLHYARGLKRRKPSRSAHLKDTRRLLEVVSFYRVSLLRITDELLQLVDKKILGFWKSAFERTQKQAVQSTNQYRHLLMTIWKMSQSNIDDHRLRQDLIRLLEPHIEQTPPSRNAAIRMELVKDRAAIRAFMHTVVTLPFSMGNNHPLHTAFDTLKKLYASNQTTLPKGPNPFANCWHSLVSGADRRAAMAAYEAATLLLLRRSLRNGSVWIDHSLNYRNREKVFIPAQQWQAQKSEYYHRLSLPVSPKNYLDPLLDSLQASLYALSAAVDDGTVEIQDDRIRVSQRKLSDSDMKYQVQDQLFKAIGDVQLPEVILEIDSLMLTPLQTRGYLPLFK